MQSARSVASYFGRTPTPVAKLLFVPVPGRRINGTTFGYGGAATRILLGSDVTLIDLKKDWVLVHELVHMGFPSIKGPHNWMHEGVATYVEPIARAQMGLIPVEEVWLQLVLGLPKGQPGADDKGLDGTPSWGRTYWGGAMYFLLADLELRSRSDNSVGLQHVLRASVAEGGNVTREWSIEQFMLVSERATGSNVLSLLHDCMKDTPRTVELTILWRDLGVRMNGRNVNFDDNAPLAHVRRAITSALANSPILPDRNEASSESVQKTPTIPPMTPCAGFRWLR